MHIKDGMVCFDNLVDAHSGKMLMIPMSCSVDTAALFEFAEAAKVSGQKFLAMINEWERETADICECFENVDAQLLAATDRNKH